MTITTPPLRVSQDRRNIIDSGGLVWAEYQDFVDSLQLRPPVTKEFSLTLSTEHTPFAVRVQYYRTKGTFSSLDNGEIVQLRFGWNHFAAKNLITSGIYWVAINPQPEPPVIQEFHIPVTIVQKGYIPVRASSLQEAHNHVVNIGACRFPHQVMGAPDVIVDEGLYLQTLRASHPRIGAYYVCSSSSRPQINGKIVQCVEIKSPRQVGVKDTFGDVYFTNPDRLTYVRG